MYPQTGLNGTDLSLAEEELFLYIGEKFYGKEGINALYYHWKDITANLQVSIDDLLREVIAGLTPLDHPTMPETNLTQGEITLCL